MSGPASEYALEDCAKKKKDIKTGEVLKVTYNRGKCDQSKDCMLLCEHKKK